MNSKIIEAQNRSLWTIKLQVFKIYDIYKNWYSIETTRVTLDARIHCCRYFYKISSERISLKEKYDRKKALVKDDDGKKKPARKVGFSIVKNW